LKRRSLFPPVSLTEIVCDPNWKYMYHKGTSKSRKMSRSGTRLKTRVRGLRGVKGQGGRVKEVP